MYFYSDNCLKGRVTVLKLPKTDLVNNLASKFLKGICEANGHGEDDGGDREVDGMDTRRQMTYN